ncbi:MAG: hypothetical protein GVY30_09805 [Chloroflexi bacterium]|nr:hypothetical protein [Chloroflexota bacterium]
MDETVRWTNLTRQEIVIALQKEHGIQVSKWVVRRLLQKHNYRRRKAQKKKLAKKDIPDRDAQFKKIARLRAQYVADGNPVISMDTKKKEYVGNLYRDGHLYPREELHTFDHDFPNLADGIIIPHSIYDLQIEYGLHSIRNQP